MRSVPRRVKTACCTTSSASVPANMRPPISEYSPSVFSRTTTKSISSGVRPASRRRQSRQQPHGPQVDVLVERAPNRDQQAPQRHVVGNARIAHRAEVDGVDAAELLEEVGGRHRAAAGEPLAAPVVAGPTAIEPVSAPGRLQDAHPLGHDLRPDAVARNQRNRVAGHPVAVSSRPDRRRLRDAAQRSAGTSGSRSSREGRRRSPVPASLTARCRPRAGRRSRRCRTPRRAGPRPCAARGAARAAPARAATPTA